MEAHSEFAKGAEITKKLTLAIVYIAVFNTGPISQSSGVNSFDLTCSSPKPKKKENDLNKGTWPLIAENKLLMTMARSASRGPLLSNGRILGSSLGTKKTR